MPTRSRFQKTLLNWRWWVALPVFFALLPFIVLSIALHCFQWSFEQLGEWCEFLQYRGLSFLDPVARIFDWVRRDRGEQ